MNRDGSGSHDSIFRRHRETFVVLLVGAACVLLGVGVPYVMGTSGDVPPRDAPAVEKDRDSDSEKEKDEKDDDEDDDENEESSGSPRQHRVVLVNDGSGSGGLSIGAG